MTPDFDHLRNINTFRQLVVYLRDELDWPIEGDDFEELTFEYSAEDLGLDSATAAKIKEIKQLRPLNSKQSWGIFFVNFEPKKLPIVALRRILSTLVLKKRQSANKANQAAWQLHDLLFISSYGESKHREITFAYFAEQKDSGDLPTLRVLGWDDEDTKLHIDHVEKVLRAKLRWPKDEGRLEDWRAQWASAFTLRPREVITTSKMLAVRLAELARSIRKRANTVLKIESEKGPLRNLYAAFKEVLIHDLSEDDFADMYAQTISYGLLTARVSRPVALVADNLSDMVPVTNPFLKELLETFLIVGGRKGRIDFDELGINEVVQLLRDADMEAVLRDFGDRNPQEDPVIHFYQDFLEQYDKQKRMQRGVFYTPRPVVSYIVRSVHQILQKEFGLEDGLADTTTWNEMLTRHQHLQPPKGVPLNEPFVQILDPATGTGTFLVEVIEVIYATMRSRWEEQGHMELEFPELWNDYVPKHLLPRLYGFELMMAPYAIAHMKIGLKLFETGYRFGSEERARVYLTNSLEPASDDKKQREFEEWAPALAHEARAVNAIKRLRRFTVVVGNPPYSNFGQLNRIPFILDLLEDYKRGLDERKINLDDDFIKFVRFSQHLLDTTGVGVFGMITNNVFIDGITHRRLRECLKTSFSDVRILDLHGSTKKLEASPDGEKDENVFDIQQGVGISLFVKPSSAGTSRIRHAELWGDRESKYRALRDATMGRQHWTTISCSPPQFFFVPKSFSGIEEYLQQPSVAGEIFVERNAGIQTKRDGLVYSFTKDELEGRLADVRSLNPNALSAKFDLAEDGRDWAVDWAKQDIRKGDGKVIRVAYHPFDLRWTYFTGRTKGFMAYPRTPLMWSALQPNRLLLTVRNPRRGNTDSFFAASTAVDKDSVSPFDNVTFFPLYVYPSGGTSQRALDDRGERRLNLEPTFLQGLCTKLGLTANGPHGLPVGLTPEDVFHYAYAVFHSPG